MNVGVLALQGASDRHAAMLARLGVGATAVTTSSHLDAVDGLIIPGGESTTMSMLLDSAGMAGPLAARLASGMPVLGTCAGMILLAEEILDGRDDQHAYGVVAMAVRRNGYGRQLDSFEAELAVPDLGSPEALRAVFIRAPMVERTGPEVDVLARVDGRPVLCRQGPVLVAAFHPELGTDPRVHAYFLNEMMVSAPRAG